MPFRAVRGHGIRFARVIMVLATSMIISAVGVDGIERTLTAQPKIRYKKTFQIRGNQEVFAFARIDPSGEFLAYSSYVRTAQGIQPTQNVLDLTTGQIVFAHAGTDGAWSPDGARLIFITLKPPAVNIWHRKTSQVTYSIAPHELGDYPNWVKRDGRDLILTISGNYYYLDEEKAVLPHQTIPDCYNGNPELDSLGNSRPVISNGFDNSIWPTLML